MELRFAKRSTGYILLAFNNCFDVFADDGKEYRIVNFYYENLEKLNIKFPIRIGILGGNKAVIHDERIPDSWYRSEFCEVCCPEELLPITQKLRNERQEMRGERSVNVTPSGLRIISRKIGQQVVSLKVGQ